MDDKKLKDIFLKSFIEVVLPEIDKINQKVESYQKEITQFKDGVYDKMDAVFGEVLSMRQEQASHHLLHEDIDEAFTKQNRKIKKLEHSSVTPHSIRK